MSRFLVNRFLIGSDAILNGENLITIKDILFRMEIGLGVFLFLSELKGLYKIRLLRSLEKTHIHQ